MSHTTYLRQVRSPHPHTHVWPPAHTKDRSIDLRSNDTCLYSGSLSHVGVLLLAPAPPLLLRAAPTARGACNAAGARLQRRFYNIQYNNTTCQINEEYSFILVSDTKRLAREESRRVRFWKGRVEPDMGRTVEWGVLSAKPLTNVGHKKRWQLTPGISLCAR